jgi:hypothetical protein
MPVTRRRVRDEDEETDEEAEERPRRRAAAEEDDADERPAKRRRARDDDDEDDDERPRKGKFRGPRDDDDDDDEDRPKKGKRPVGSVRAGWKGVKENKSKSSDFHEDLKITGEPELVKFLEEEPFASYRMHWVDTPPAGIKKKSWICIEDDCPLCDLGDRPRMQTAFNVLHISNGGTPDNKILTLGNKAVGQLEGFASDDKTGPLPRLYWAISKSGKNQSTAYNFRPVKVRDLEEDWDVDPDEIEGYIEEAEAKAYTFEDLQIPTRKQLREVSAGLTDEDDD